MENLMQYATGNDTPVFADDMLLSIARQAEARIDAVVKIKQIALKVTNPSDWTDQQGKPYMQVSGAEKVANLFEISWRIDEPLMEEETDGTITYTYKGTFTLKGRSIEVEGSRSSRDTFFKKYDYDQNGKRAGEKPLDRRDLKMAAMTNLLGNGISRILGIRNLTWDDLKQFAGITQDMVKGKVVYKNQGQKVDMKPPGSKSAPTNGQETPVIKDPEAPASENQVKAISTMLSKLGIPDNTRHDYVSYILDIKVESFKNLNKQQASTIIDKLNTALKEKEAAAGEAA